MATLAELFAAMPERFNAEAAGDMNATVVFDLTGESSGTWHVKVADGEVTVHEGSIADPTSTIMMDGEDYKAMVTGELNPVTAFMTGKVKVEGDLNTVMQFQTLFM